MGAIDGNCSDPVNSPGVIAATTIGSMVSGASSNGGPAYGFGDTDTLGAAAFAESAGTFIIEGAVAISEGAVVTPEGAGAFPEGAGAFPKGAVAIPEGASTFPAGAGRPRPAAMTSAMTAPAAHAVANRG